MLHLDYRAVSTQIINNLKNNTRLSSKKWRENLYLDFRHGGSLTIYVEHNSYDQLMIWFNWDIYSQHSRSNITRVR